MIRRSPLLLIALAFAPVAFLPPPASPARDKKGDAVELFNGKDLKGWRIYLDPRGKSDRPGEVFTVKDGVIHCQGRPFGYIITEKEYDNYVLTLEWRWPGKGGNSGVFVHVSGPNKIWPKGAEAQLMSGHAGDFWLVDNFKLDVDKDRQDRRTPRHYFRRKTDRPVEKPLGEWNKYEIICKGDTIRLVINGQVINEGKNAEATRGKILLQSEGTPIEFRNIRLKPLK